MNYNKTNIILIPQTDKTQVFCLAIHKQKEKNEFKTFPSHWSSPIGSCVCDDLNNQYCIKCYDLLNLGTIPISYKVAVDGCSYWEQYIPMPEKLIFYHLALDQKNDLKKFKKIYSVTDDIYFEFLQMLKG